MKREMLEAIEVEGRKLHKEVIDQIMAEHGKDIEVQKSLAANLQTERDTLQSQLTAANAEIQSFKDMDIDGIRGKAAEWEEKYNTETQALQAQLEAANYGFAVKEAVSGIKFSSESAKKAFVADLTEKKLPLEEGKLLGLEDFTKGYRESDPGAFVPENDDKIPVFSRGTGEHGLPGSGADNALRAAIPDVVSGHSCCFIQAGLNMRRGYLGYWQIADNGIEIEPDDPPVVFQCGCGDGRCLVGGKVMLCPICKGGAAGDDGLFSGGIFGLYFGQFP